VVLVGCMVDRDAVLYFNTCELYVTDYGIVLSNKLYIKEIQPGGIASQDGSLREGDTIIRVCN